MSRGGLTGPTVQARLIDCDLLAIRSIETPYSITLWAVASSLSGIVSLSALAVFINVPSGARSVSE